MNVLAHLFLAAPHEGLMIGNFIGDHVKGRQLAQYPAPVALGVRHHRAIDAFTDQHPLVRQSAARLQPRYRRYAAVLVDIFYDHFLARHWAEFSAVPLRQFADQAYTLLLAHEPMMPAQAQRFLGYARQYDILVNYAQPAAITRVLQGMSRRAQFVSGMEHATEELLHYQAEFQAEFQAFFPELQAFAADFLTNQ
jgi:acyl carrier protein phosphodiesterase